MPFTQRPGANLYWKRDGRDHAPALVLLHSIGTDMDVWDGMLPHLRDRFTLLRIDARGHGASVAEAGDYTLAMLADDVLSIADDAGLDRFSVAGLSLGGMVGMELALRAPARIEKLMLVCTSATMDAASWDDRVATVRRDGMAAIADLTMGRFLSDAVEPALFQAVRRQLLAMDQEGYAGCGAAIRDMALADRIADIACPTLIVTGTRDTSTPFEGHGAYLLAQIPGASHAGLEAAHLAPLEAPDALATIMTLFLEN